MYVKTEKIELKDVDKETSCFLIDTLKNEYRFNFTKPRVKVFLEKTAASKVYLLESDNNEKLVIKRSFWYENANNTSGAFEKAHEISEAWRVRSVKVPKVYKNKQNKFFTKKDKDNIVVLEFVAGEHFRACDAEFKSAGKELGILHRIGLELLESDSSLYKGIEKEIPFEKPYEESRSMYGEGLRDKLLSDHKCEAPEVCQMFRNNIDDIDNVIKFLDESDINNDSLKRGILHNDLHTNNVLFDEEGDLTTILDIDQVGVGPFIWDVGNTLTSFVSNYLKEGSEEEVKEKTRLFLQSYHDENPLLLKEYEFILAATQRWDMLRIFRSLRRHHYENNRLPGLLPKIKERLIPRIKAIPEIFAFINSDWLRKNIK